MQLSDKNENELLPLSDSSHCYLCTGHFHLGLQWHKFEDSFKVKSTKRIYNKTYIFCNWLPPKNFSRLKIDVSTKSVHTVSIQLCKVPVCVSLALNRLNRSTQSRLIPELSAKHLVRKIKNRVKKTLCYHLFFPKISP